MGTDIYLHLEYGKSIMSPIIANYYSCGSIDICPECRRQLPEHNHYHVYKRPPEEAHWMWSKLHGPTSFIITNEVFQFFKKNEKRTMRILHLLQQGWFPDEVKEAFVPEVFQKKKKKKR
ncbi:MAG: hypothetical protein GY714_32340 [Desulfobacterales bacterium]|nr:hypothetical protein [Desulfobacterales bacterium]